MRATACLIPSFPKLFRSSPSFADLSISSWSRSFHSNLTTFADRRSVPISPTTSASSSTANTSSSAPIASTDSSGLRPVNISSAVSDFSDNTRPFLTISSFTSVKIPVSWTSSFSVAASSFRTLLYSYGKGRYGGLGHGNWKDIDTAIPIPSIQGNIFITDVACGWTKNLALTSDHRVIEWGYHPMLRSLIVLNRLYYHFPRLANRLQNLGLNRFTFSGGIHFCCCCC